MAKQELLLEGILVRSPHRRTHFATRRRRSFLESGLCPAIGVMDAHAPKLDIVNIVVHKGGYTAHPLHDLRLSALDHLQVVDVGEGLVLVSPEHQLDPVALLIVVVHSMIMMLWVSKPTSALISASLNSPSRVIPRCSCERD